MPFGPEKNDPPGPSAAASSVQTLWPANATSSTAADPKLSQQSWPAQAVLRPCAPWPAPTAVPLLLNTANLQQNGDSGAEVAAADVNPAIDSCDASLGGVKKSKAKIEVDTIDASDGLDTLANLAILGAALPSQQTTKHPRHRPGCSCIVCIQPPSGKGPKHKQTCTCNVCMTVRRRFRTLMLRREKRKDTDSPRKKEAGQSSETVSHAGSGPSATSASTTSSPQKAEPNADGPEDMAVDHKMTSSPVKNHIDLNIQPDRNDEQSPKADAAGAMRLLQDNPT